MTNWDKWFERVYGETDFGKSVATTVAGATGLVTYLLFKDWVISVFAAVIVFPVTRLMSTALYERVRRFSTRKVEGEHAGATLDAMGDGELGVVEAFVEAGTAVLTWNHVNQLDISNMAVESLVHRGLISTSMTADLLRETFVLDTAIFEQAVKRRRSLPRPQD